jgi:hypothetical protein
MNTYIGPNNGSWNNPANWSNGDTNWNEDCLIQSPPAGLLSGPLTVIYDTGDGAIGQVGSLTLNNANLIFTTNGGSKTGYISTGPITLTGNSTIIFPSGWTINSGEVNLRDTAAVTLSGWWSTGNDRFILRGQSSMVLSGELDTAELSTGPLTTLTLITCMLVGDLCCSGDLYLSYPASPSFPATSVVFGNAETGTGFFVMVSAAGCASLFVSGTANVPAAAKPNPQGIGPGIFNYCYVASFGTIQYATADQSFLGLTYSVLSGTQVAGPNQPELNLLVWVNPPLS